MKQSKRIDYTAKSFEMDFTDLERLPTDTGIPLIDRLNTELNEQSERLEDFFIAVACENMDNPRKCAFYKELRKKRAPVFVLPESDKEDIREFYRTGRHSKTELQELYGLKRNQINGIVGNIDRWSLQYSHLHRHFSPIEEEDDFDILKLDKYKISIPLE